MWWYFAFPAVLALVNWLWYRRARKERQEELEMRRAIQREEIRQEMEDIFIENGMPIDMAAREAQEIMAPHHARRRLF